jgi:methionyl-tRNA formyltransferase
MNIAFFGTSEFACGILEKLAGSPWRPAIAVTTPDAPRGRGKRVEPPPVKIAAERLGITVIQPVRLSPILYPLSSPADLFIVAAYGMILPSELLKIPKHGSLNVHPSLLPRWRGPSPIQYTILHGDTATGVTVILMDEAVDHGQIVGTKTWNIESRKITARALSEQLSELGAELLLEVIPHWLNGTITPVPQDESRVTYSTILKKENGRIDWSQSADTIERMARAFTPWPGAYAFWKKNGNQVRLVIEDAEARVMNEEKAGVAGTVFEQYDGFGVVTGKDILAIKRLKPAGGTSMFAEDFLRGHPTIIGSIL